MERLRAFIRRNPRNLFVAGAVIVAVTMLVLAFGVTRPTGTGQARPAPSETTPTAEPGQASECRRVGVGFARSFFDRTTRDDEQWRRNVTSWLTPDTAGLFNRIDRAKVPTWKVIDATVAAQPKSCDVAVRADKGTQLVVVEQRPTGWLVTSWE